MTVYVHTGDGHYIGSAVIVAAFSYADASDMIREILNSMGLHEEELNIKVVDITDPKVIYQQSGDY